VLLGSTDIRDTIDKAGAGLVSWALSALGEVWKQGVAIISLFSLVVITPIVAFYMLLDWDNMVERVDELLPREHAMTIRGLFREMDAVLSASLSGLVRGLSASFPMSARSAAFWWRRCSPFCSSARRIICRSAS
jgi:predicted PurR-regulated permease PerM